MKFIFVVFAIISFQLYGVSKTKEENTNSIKPYFVACLEAENQLLEEKFDSAAYFYSVALNYHFFFPNEQFLVLAITDHLTTNAINELITGWFKWSGGDIPASKFLENLPLIKNYSPAEKERLLDILMKTNAFHKKEKMDYSEIESVFEKIAKTDQEYRTPWQAETKTLLKKRLKTDSYNLKLIKKLYKKYGSIQTNYLRNQNGLRLVLMHNFFHERKRKKYFPFFEQEVIKGNIHPKTFQNIVDNYLFDSTQVYGLNTYFICNDTLIVYRLTQKGLDKFNKNRSRIYLDDINTMHKKAIWQFQHNDKLRFIITNEITPISQDETVEKTARYYQNKMADLVEGFEIVTR